MLICNAVLLPYRGALGRRRSSCGAQPRSFRKEPRGGRGRASRRGGWAVEGRPNRSSSTAATGEGSMSQDGGKRVITRARYDAVLFDLDGVLTDTASLHAACWKQT